MKIKRAAALAAVIIFITSAVSGCGNKPMKDTGYYFDTVINITIYDSGDKALLEGCFDLCQKYDYMFSRTYTSSELYKLNEAAEKADVSVEVSDELAEIISYGLYYSSLTNGIFDITIGSVTRLWNFRSDTPSIPDSNDIADALNHVDYSEVSVNGNIVTMKQGTVIDLGGVAKGYIADKINAYLTENGVEHALIDLGGNILPIGGKTDGGAYNIGIQKPFSDSGELYAVISTTDMSVVTSGNYERYFTYNGMIYHHILDTATGYPIDNGINSVTVIARDSLTAEILSTACFALGIDRALDLAASMDEVYALFIMSDGSHITSAGFDEKVAVTYK